MATAPGYSPISSQSRVQILATLINQPDRTIDDLSRATGLHANTVREHLQRLMTAGFVLEHRERRTTRGRPRALYRVATGDEHSSSPVLRALVREAAERGDLMRRVLPETIDGGLTDEENHQLDAIVEALAVTGFDPVVDTEQLTVDLSPCAHLDGSGPTTRCAVHMTMLQTVLTEAGGPLRIQGMRPTCNPQDCVLQLLRTTKSASPESSG